MLVQIAVENFLSFNDEVEFSMVASGLQGLENHKVETGFSKPEHLLRMAAIYGGNASGKTNLLKAFRIVQHLVTEGVEPGKTLPYSPFKLHSDKLNQPSSIEIILFLDGQFYTYGVVFSKNEILEEWLFAQRPGAQERKFFERKTEKGKTKVTTGKSLQEEDYSNKVLQMVASTTRPNQSYLHTLWDNNHKGISPIIDWFSETLELIPAVSQYRHLTNRAVVDEDFIDLVNNVLSRVDIGIDRVTAAQRKIDLKRDLHQFPDEIRLDIEQKLREADETTILFISTELSQLGFRKDGDDIIEITLKVVRKNENGEDIFFDLEEESDGTNRLLHLLPALADISQEPRVVFIDELDRRMHPKLSDALLRLFNQLVKPGNKSQFIFTTHDTNLMNLDHIRRDEIWFMERDEFHGSRIESLSEYGVRNGGNIGKDYLLGRFSGVPNIRYDLTGDKETNDTKEEAFA